MTLTNKLDAALASQIRRMLAARGERVIRRKAAEARRILGKLETATKLNVINSRRG